MRELDVLLSSWLNTSYLNAGADLQRAFELLLDREDDEIWDWMMGRATAPDELVDVVRAICSQHENEPSEH